MKVKFWQKDESKKQGKTLLPIQSEIPLKSCGGCYYLGIGSCNPPYMSDCPTYFNKEQRDLEENKHQPLNIDNSIPTIVERTITTYSITELGLDRLKRKDTDLTYQEAMTLKHVSEGQYQPHSKEELDNLVKLNLVERKNVVTKIKSFKS